MTTIVAACIFTSGPVARGEPPGPDDPDVTCIFQFFAPAEAAKAPATAGGYLWIPPQAPVIRAVMVGIHNGLPAPLLQHPDVRHVCRRHGIAQILLTPNDCEIGTMLAGLRFDLDDPARTAIYDRFLERLAGLSGHPELTTAPIVPLAHSAYMSFPFEAAARRPERCLGAIGIKSGTPDLYAMYPPGADGRPARRLFALQSGEMRREVELFTVLDSEGRPIDLSEGPMAVMPDAARLLHGDGLFSFTTHHFTTPPRICTVTERGHAAGTASRHELGNPLFPGRTSLATSGIPLAFDPHGGPVELVAVERRADVRDVIETTFTLRLARHRLAPHRGFQMLFPRIYHEGDERFAAAGRTVQLAWAPGDAGRPQTVDFPPIADAPATEAAVELEGSASSGLPVSYFVVQGPGVIREGRFVPCEVPAGSVAPIEVTIGAYQRGAYDADGAWQATPTVYRTFRLIP